MQFKIFTCLNLDGFCVVGIEVQKFEIEIIKQITPWFIGFLLGWPNCMSFLSVKTDKNSKTEKTSKKKPSTF